MGGEDRQTLGVGRLDHDETVPHQFLRRQPNEFRNSIRRQVLHNLGTENTVQRELGQVAEISEQVCHLGAHAFVGA